MAELVEIIADGEGYREVHEHEQGTYRVGQLRWATYVKARTALLKAERSMEDNATRPVFVTPDQEEAIRSVAKPHAWIVVQEPEEPRLDILEPELAQVREAAILFPPIPPPPPAPPVPEGPPQPPSPQSYGRCEARGGLPHAALRFVITETPSVYYPGKTRIDGLCQCGYRIPDVKCPHQKQELNARLQPACKMCHAQLGSNAGAIDNRNMQWRGTSPNGAADPNIRLPVSAGATEAPADAYRSPGA